MGQRESVYLFKLFLVIIDAITIDVNTVWVGDAIGFGLGFPFLSFLLLCLDLSASHSGTQNRIPVNEERLCKVLFDADREMVNIVIVCIIAEEEL